MSGGKGANIAEAAIGFAVSAVAIGFLAFAMVKTGDTRPAAGGYNLTAAFDRADGIAAGADVRVSGVKVGAVSKIVLDPQTFKARVLVSLDPKVKLPEDSTARVASDGLLGGAYVSIDPGGAVDYLPQNGEFEYTQGSVDLLTLFASFAGGAGKGGEAKPAAAAPAADDLP